MENVYGLFSYPNKFCYSGGVRHHDAGGAEPDPRPRHQGDNHQGAAAQAQASSGKRAGQFYPTRLGFKNNK